MRAGAAAVQSRRAGVGQRLVRETDMAATAVLHMASLSQRMHQRITQQNGLSTLHSAVDDSTEIIVLQKTQHAPLSRFHVFPSHQCFVDQLREHKRYSANKAQPT